jgi:hypothetical protein
MQNFCPFRKTFQQQEAFPFLSLSNITLLGSQQNPGFPMLSPEGVLSRLMTWGSAVKRGKNIQNKAAKPYILTTCFIASEKRDLIAHTWPGSE